MLTLFGKGFALGLAIAAPVGPIGLLCIRRALSDGPALAFATGLGRRPRTPPMVPSPASAWPPWPT